MKRTLASSAASAALALVLLPHLASGAAADTAQHEPSGVQKVIQMLTDMSAKGKKEKNEEEVAFVKFEAWCTSSMANLKADISAAADEAELIDTEIDTLDGDVEELDEDVNELHDDESNYEADLEAERKQREKDHAAFLETEKDLSESIDALDRALAKLSEENYDRPAAAAALLQVSSRARMPDEAQSMVAAFLGMAQEGKDSPVGGTDYEAPEANAYEFQSGGIITMLKKLQDDFRDKLATAQKEEMNSQHAFNMIEQDLKDSVENANRGAKAKSKTKDRKTAKMADDKKQLQGTSSAKNADVSTLSEVTDECREKKYSFQEKQQMRAEELEAIAKAIEIMKSPDVLGSEGKHLSLAQASSSAASLVQSGRSLAMAKTQGMHRRVREFLASEGRRLHSKQIALLAEKMSKGEFNKVKQMIEALIERLVEESTGDADHEAFCGVEMGKSKMTRNKLNEEIESLNAAIEDGRATVIKLTEDSAQLTKEIESLNKDMGEATRLRNEEKAKNKETIADAEVAQAAVAKATAVLKDFYEKAGTATALIQIGAASPHGYWGVRDIRMGTDEWKALANPNFEASDHGHKEGMQTFGETDQGQQDEGGVVVGLMEVVQSDFAALEADTKSAEEVAAKAYQSFMTESKRNKATKEKNIDMNNADRVDAEAKVQEATADLKTTQDQLLAAERYHKKLVPQCVDQGMSWEERVAARKAEMDSLKEALKILGNQ